MRSHRLTRAAALVLALVISVGLLAMPAFAESTVPPAETPGDPAVPSPINFDPVGPDAILYVALGALGAVAIGAGASLIQKKSGK